MVCKASTDVLKQNKVQGYLLPQKDMCVVISHSIHEVSDDWDVAAPLHNIFLQRPYLTLLEDNPPGENVHFLYMLYYKESKPIGVAIGQVGNFNAKNSRNDNIEKVEASNSSGFFSYLTGLVARKVDVKAIVLGNALLTGAHHNISFNDPTIGEEQSCEILNDTLKFIQKEMDKKGVRLSLYYLKEYCGDQREVTQKVLVKKCKFHEFTAQPNMVLRFREGWNSFDDYLAAMSSKYRVRVKRAKKKGKAIVKKEFSLQEIEGNLPRIYELYEEIAEGSVFNLVKLNPQYFPALKATYGDDFKLTGYYIEDKLVAFFTTIKSHDELEAHFLGYDKPYNREYQMYLNILYDIIKIGFDYQCKYIVFARTALEIKSSVGAEPEDMYWYLRHRSKFTNRFLAQIVDYLNPKDEWVQRKPFKDG